jgi:hypothetical protein
MTTSTSSLMSISRRPARKDRVTKRTAKLRRFTASLSLMADQIASTGKGAAVAA